MTAHAVGHWPSGPLVAGCEDCNSPAAIAERRTTGDRTGWIRWTDDGDIIRVTFAHDGRVLVDVFGLVKMLRQTLEVLPNMVGDEDTIETVKGLIDLTLPGRAGWYILPIAGVIVEVDPDTGDEL